MSTPDGATVDDSTDWTVEDEDGGERLDRHVARLLDVPRNQIRQWITDGHVTLNGRRTKPSRAVAPGERIVCVPPPPPPETLEPEAEHLIVLYEDADLAVLDKPADLVVHPGAGRDTGTLAHQILDRWPETSGIGGPGRPGIVHRLDKDTTGALVVARSERAYRALSTAFAEREVEKTYLAIVYGTPQEGEGVVDLPIGRDPRDRKRMAVRGAAGRPARTRYRTLASAAGISWLEIDLETGRTHQIRVHLKAIRHPLVGDPVYGEARWKELEPRVRRRLERFPRPALHAWRLAFAHPADGRRIEVEAAVPEDLHELWSRVTGTASPVGAPSSGASPIDEP